jgi:hypothetical protein
VTGPIAALATDALACLARECPAAHVGLREALGARRLRVELGDEVFDVAGGEIEAVAGAAALELSSDARALHAVLHGELDVLDAVVTDRVRVRGPVDDVIAATTMMELFVAGALRCPSMPALFERLGELARGDVA